MTPNLKQHDLNVIRAHYAKLGRAGAKARAASLTPERRREIAKAARAVGVAKQAASRAKKTSQGANKAQEPSGAAGTAKKGLDKGKPVRAPRRPATAARKAPGGKVSP